MAADPVSAGTQPLPAARAEGKEVAEFFPGAALVAGESATRGRVLADLPKYGILHFATHGVLDAEDGLRSGLLLASEKGVAEYRFLKPAS